MSLNKTQISSRFSYYSTVNHQAPIWIVTTLSLIYSFLLLVVRAAVKYKSTGLDDVVLVVAYITALGQWILIYSSLHEGAGRADLNGDDLSALLAAKLVFASRPLTFATIAITKCSLALFLRQLFTRNNIRVWRGCSILVAIAGCWTVASAVLVSVGLPSHCSLGSEGPPACCRDTLRLRIATAVDICFEAIMAAVPAYVFSSLQMTVARKVTVISAFAFRLGVAALSVAYLESYLHFSDRGRHGLDATTYIVLQQILITFALISATIPCLRNFLGRFRTGDLARLSETENDRYTYGSREETHSNAFALSSLDQQGRPRSRREKNHFVRLQPDGQNHSTTVYAGQEDEVQAASVRSFGSEQMIIRKKIEVDVVRQ